MDCAIDTLKEWQTLVAGLLALIAAIATVWILVCQLRLQKSQLDALQDAAREIQRRKLLACRAVLPADLSAIMKHAEECARTVGIALRMLRREQDRESLATNTLPDRVVGNLQALIEQLNEPDAEKIADLLACYQVQLARLNGELALFNNPDQLGVTRIITEENMEFTLEKTVELFLIAESMFSFARREVHEIPEPQFNQDNVSHAVMRLRLENVISDRCEDQLSRALVQPN